MAKALAKRKRGRVKRQTKAQDGSVFVPKTKSELTGRAAEVLLEAQTQRDKIWAEIKGRDPDLVALVNRFISMNNAIADMHAIISGLRSKK